MLVLVTFVFLIGYLPFITVNVVALFDGETYGFYAGSGAINLGHSGSDTSAGEKSGNIDFAASGLQSAEPHSQSIPGQSGLSVLTSSMSAEETSSTFGTIASSPSHQRHGSPSPLSFSYGQRLALELCIRSHFLSSAANPLIYSILNVRFRQESMVALRHVILRLPHWLRQRFKGQHGVT